jgi:hypothetical protein
MVRQRMENVLRSLQELLRVRVQDVPKKGRGCENVEREGNKAVKGSLRLWVVQVVKIVFGVFDIFPAFLSCLLPGDSFLSPTTRLLLACRPYLPCPQ